jgi:kojibiose phosphorylase
MPETDVWNDIIKKAKVNYDAEKSLYIEDDNFFKLEPIDLGSFKEGDAPLYKKICFDRLQRYRVLKQADVLLLMQLLPDRFSTEEKMNAWHFYEPLTTHDSSLSYGTHSAIAARIGLVDEAYDYFMKSVCLDIDDIMGNTGMEGIHFASAGAVWQAVANGFGGVEYCSGGLRVNPHMPLKWKMLSFKLCYRDCIIKFEISQQSLSVTLEDGAAGQLPIWVGENRVILYKGKTEKVLLSA